MDATTRPQTSIDDLRRALDAVGLQRGDKIIVHSALSAFGRVDGGPDAVVDLLLEQVGPEGTVVFPTFTGDTIISAILGGAGGASGAVILPDVGDVDLSDMRHPRIEHINTGAVPKAARRRPDFAKSNHPLYSIAGKGPLMPRLIAANEKYIFPSQADKDLYLLAMAGGKVLLLGCDLISNSSIHLISEFAELDYKVQDRPYWKMTVDEFLALPRARQAELLRIHCGMYLSYDIKKRYDRIEELLRQANGLRLTQVGSAQIRLIDTQIMLRVGLEAVRRNPWLLADKCAKD